MVQATGTARAAETHHQVAVRLGELADRYPRATELHEVTARFAGPPRIAVSGRAGSGRRTLRRALAERLGCVTTDVAGGEADIAMHLLVSAPRDEDRQTIARLPVGRTLLVVGKADVIRGPAVDVDGLCPVVRRAAPLLATLRPTDADVRLLRALAVAGVRRPVTAAESIATVPDEISGAATELARRVGRGAMHLCLEAVAAQPDISGPEFEMLLVERSGIAELLDPIRELARAAVPQRLSRVARELDRLAASGVARDELECLLAGELLAADSLIPANIDSYPAIRRAESITADRTDDHHNSGGSLNSNIAAT